jgi:uncharacterized lipoprotein YajG
MRQSLSKTRVGICLATFAMAACSQGTPTELAENSPPTRRGGVYIGASGYSVTPRDSTPQVAESSVSSDTTSRGGVYIGAGGY